MPRLCQFLLLLTLSLFTLNSCNDRDESDVEVQQITIGVAASLGPLFKALAKEFEREHPAYEITISTAGSNLLARQATAGIPFDLIALASTRLMEGLEREGIVRRGSITTFATNRLILVEPPARLPFRINTLTDLLDPRIERIAIASAGVPVGEYTREVLERTGLLDTLTPRFIYGGNVRAVLAWVERGDADCGFVYRTDLKNSSATLSLTIDSTLHRPITYTIGVVENVDNKNEDNKGEKFVEFLRSKRGKKIVREFGF